MSCLLSSHRFLVAVASMVVGVLAPGVAYGNAAVYYQHWLGALGGSPEISAVCSASFGVLCLAGPLASVLTNRFGVRRTVMLGGIISTAGMAAASFCATWEGLLICYGIVTGVGWCIAYVPGSVAVSAYFPDKYHGLLFGLCLSGNGFGMFIAPPAVEALSEVFSWRGALLIQAGINLHLVACGALMFPVTEPKYENLLDLQLLKNRTFLLFLIHMAVFAVGISVFSVHFAFAVQTSAHVSALDAALAVSVVGLSGTAGRILQGIIAKLPGVNALLQHLVSFFFLGIGMLIVPHLRTYHVALTLATVIGFLQGPYGGVVPILITYMIGHKNITSGYGYFHLFVGVGVIVGAPLAGFLYDYGGGSYYWSMYFGGGVIVGSTLMMAPVVTRWNKVILDTQILMEREKDLVLSHDAKTIHDAAPPIYDATPPEEQPITRDAGVTRG